MPTTPETAKGAGYTIRRAPNRDRRFCFERPNGSVVHLETCSEASAWDAANRDWHMRRAAAEVEGARPLPSTINGYPLIAAIPHVHGLLCIAVRAGADPHPFVVWRLYVQDGEWIAASGFYADTLAEAVADMCQRVGLAGVPVLMDA